MATLRTTDLTKSFGGRTVVRGVSVEISSGEVVGSARPERRRQDDDVLDGGRAWYRRTRDACSLDGNDVTEDPMYVRARKGIGYLPQEAVDLSRPDGRTEHSGDSRNARPGFVGTGARGCVSCWRSSA